jgi:hypothetical protein
VATILARMSSCGEGEGMNKEPVGREQDRGAGYKYGLPICTTVLQELYTTLDLL